MRTTVTTTAAAAAALVVASLLIFLALHHLPGDRAAIAAGTDATPEQTAAIRTELGLDRPVLVQYADWAGGAVRGDLGTSASTGQPVAAVLAEKLQVTGPLTVASMLLSTLVAVPVGCWAAARRHRWDGRLIGALTQLGVAVPTFILGIGLVVLVALHWQLLPATGFPRDRWADPVAAVRSLVLPVVVLAVPQAAVLVRFVRSAVIDVLGQDHLRTARAQGLSRTRALIGHGLRNASLPLVSVLALEAAGLIMGAVLVEQVFALPGVGSMILRDVSTRDIAMVQGTLLVLSAAVIALMLVMNLVYSALDPRVRIR
ncbi:ABC transporter permease [Modestobacter sp. VKM Ac-2676]|nr:ABC transporter permease [Modestobacter sp. VKM Ac-2676]